MLFCIVFTTIVYFSKPERTQHPPQVVGILCVCLFLKQRKKLGLYSIYVVLPESWWGEISFDSGYETKRFGSCLI